MESKAQLLTELNDTRDNLWRELAAIDDQAQISPGMTKCQILAHIAGWESLVFEALREHVYGIPAVNQPYHGVDALNSEFLSQRQGATVASAKRECEINRFAILTMLTTIPEAEFEKPVRFRWGEETVTQFIQGAISHEREHAGEAAEFRRTG